MLQRINRVVKMLNDKRMMREREWLLWVEFFEFKVGGEREV